MVNTKQIGSGLITPVITQRVSTGFPVTETNLTRVATYGTSTSGFANTWAGCWAGSWGSTWGGAVLTTVAEPGIAVTARVNDAALSDTGALERVKILDHLLVEGGLGEHFLLEGGGFLDLEGDMVGVTINHTKRVLQ